MDHRKTPARKALTLPGWIIVVSALICLGAASYYVVLLVDGNSSSPSANPAATTTPAPTATTPAPTPTKQSTPPPATETTASPVVRDIPVGVYNNTGTAGLAATVADKVKAAGWTVAGVGNWSGVIPETTVYYPPGFEKQAQTLAGDLDFSRIKPLVAPMRSDRLTLILSGPQ